MSNGGIICTMCYSEEIFEGNRNFKHPKMTSLNVPMPKMQTRIGVKIIDSGVKVPKFISQFTQFLIVLNEILFLHLFICIREILIVLTPSSRIIVTIKYANHLS